jgi:hypothetical protein
MLHVSNGTLAQLVEQWTENPCVPGSIPGGTTSKALLIPSRVFCFILDGSSAKVALNAVYYTVNYL